MAKALLREFKIGADVIDRVAPPAVAPASSESSSLNSAGDAVPPESPPAGARPQAAAPEGASGGTAAAAAVAAADGELRFERDGLFHAFTIGELEYRVGGVRQLFVTSLKVNIRASTGGSSYYDSLDPVRGEGEDRLRAGPGEELRHRARTSRERPRANP